MTAERHRAALVDLALAAALVAIELSDMFAFDPGGRHDPLDVFLLVGSAAVIVIRRRLPLLCFQLAGAATIVLAARHAPHIGIGAIAATYAVSVYGSPRTRHVAALLLLVAVWLAPLLTADVGSIPRNVALFGAAWLLGQLMRERREQHERYSLRRSYWPASASRSWRSLPRQSVRVWFARCMTCSPTASA